MTKESFKDKPKLYMPHSVPKPGWEDVKYYVFFSWITLDSAQKDS